MPRLKTLDIVALALVIVGGLNWGLVGFFQFDLVAWLFGGSETAIARVVYALVGLAAVYLLAMTGKLARK
jgi:uncharacterized protein